jgi:hypothetical protein
MYADGFAEQLLYLRDEGMAVWHIQP